MSQEVRILITGDTHIPTRARGIPKIMLREIEKNIPYDYLLFTGDLVSNNVLDMISKWADKVYVVRGNMDYLNLPDKQTLNINRIKIGLIHGHQVYPRGDVYKLSRIAINLGVRILVSGHTHNPFIEIMNIQGHNILLLNPGSLTGVWSGGFASMKPAFMIGNIKDDKFLINLYEADYKLVCKEYVFKI